jgi:hypothetical protein
MQNKICLTLAPNGAVVGFRPYRICTKYNHLSEMNLMAK